MPFDVSVEDAQEQFKNYTILERLTLSQFKAAFRVQDPEGNEYCLKIIRPDFASDRLDREILAMTELDHPNIGSLVEYSFRTVKGQSQHYMIESFVPGNDLSVSLAEAPWEVDKIKRVFIPLCDALQAIREADLVHRDLKPSNIRLKPDDSPVVIDFGLVRHLDLPDLTATADGARIGTPSFFAPEQFRGTKHDIEHRTDLFALGVMIYLAATGRHPFIEKGEALDMAQLEARVCDGGDHLEATDFLALPTILQLIIQKLLSRDRADRPVEASQVAALLNKLEA